MREAHDQHVAFRVHGHPGGAVGVGGTEPRFPFDMQVAGDGGDVDVGRVGGRSPGVAHGDQLTPRVDRRAEESVVGDRTDANVGHFVPARFELQGERVSEAFRWRREPRVLGADHEDVAVGAGGYGMHGVEPRGAELPRPHGGERRLRRFDGDAGGGRLGRVGHAGGRDLVGARDRRRGVGDRVARARERAAGYGPGHAFVRRAGHRGRERLLPSGLEGDRGGADAHADGDGRVRLVRRGGAGGQRPEGQGRQHREWAGAYVGHVRPPARVWETRRYASVTRTGPGLSPSPPRVPSAPGHGWAEGLGRKG